MNGRIRTGAAAIAIVSVVAMLLLASCTPAPSSTPPTPTPAVNAPASTTPTPSVATSPTVPATTTPSVESTGVSAKPAENGKHIAFVRGMHKQGSAYVFVLDYADLLTGDAAYAQGAKDGVDVENDYYIRNTSAKVRSLLTLGNPIYITYGDSPSQKWVYKVSDFYKWRTSSKKPSDFPELGKSWTLYTQAQAKGDQARPFFFTVKKGLITRVEFFWTP